MNEKRFQVGIKGAIVRDNKVLLLRSALSSTGEKYWDLPGGRIDVSDKTFDETLIREVSEELPQITNVVRENLLHVFRMPRDFPDGTGALIIVFRVTCDLPSGPLELSEEHAEERWLTKDEVVDLYENTDILFPEGMYQAAINALV